jgi:hypothetical protein
MTENYFAKFPTIVYNNTVTRNISERVSIIKGGQRIPTNYYPYELIDGLRPDVLSNSYYKDPTMDWLVFLTNGMTDPYYDWYLGTDEFNTYIETKYGSYENAVDQIDHYRNNWADDGISMTISSFAAQTPAVQKYYTPTFGVKSSILSYERRKEDWTASTNQIVRITVSNGGTFEEGERVDVYDPINPTGAGTVITGNTSALYINHVSGNNSVEGYTVKGRSSNAIAVIVSSRVEQYVIPLSEQVFYSPVTSFDIENEKNEAQKFIYLLNSSSALGTAEAIRKQLNNV